MGDVSPHEDERRVYRAIIYGRPVDPPDRQVADVVLRRWTWHSWRLAILCVALVSGVWEVVEYVGRLMTAPGWRVAIMTLVYALGTAGLLAVARQQVRLRRWVRRFPAPSDADS